MKKLTRENLFSLEKYSEIRNDFRLKIMAHKKNRRLAIGPNTTLYFEDSLIMRYQIQEMLRAEKIFESSAIDDELVVYNALIPDGNNWKATFMIEFTDEEERRAALKKMLGIENNLWLKIEGFNEIHPVSDEDLERRDDNKTSAVHFLRFELSSDLIKSLNHSVTIIFGIDHENYQHNTGDLAEAIKTSIIKDLD